MEDKVPSLDAVAVLDNQFFRRCRSRWLYGLQSLRDLGAVAQVSTSRGQSLLWGKAVDAAGRRVVSRLRGPESYMLMAQVAGAVTQRVLAGKAPPGFQTPATAYGPDFVLTLQGIVRTDE